VIPTGEAARLADVVSAWAGGHEAAVRMGAAARELFLRRFDRPHAVGAYAESLFKCLGPAAPAEGRGMSTAEAGAEPKPLGKV
jgi:hypothetical protein